MRCERMKLNSIWRQTIFTSLLHACHTESALSSADHISFLSILSFFSDSFLRTAPMNKQHRFETITLIETNSITMHFYINRANICVFRDRDFIEHLSPHLPLSFASMHCLTSHGVSSQECHLFQKCHKQFHRSKLSNVQ